ncbi:MAG TPA: DUF4097 family beta strand repeat-containing protein [Rhodothermales bacterium]|nr:DUF4097 family beta strand repeat-containing protein [Rhodothermales bacterium]
MQIPTIFRGVWKAAFVLVVMVSLAACQGKDAGVSQTEEGQLVLGEEEQTDVVERAVAIGARTLVLDGYRGTITLNGTDDRTASLTFTKHARGRDAEAAAKALERVSLEEEGDETKYEYVMRARDPNLTSVDITGEVPRNTNVDIRLESGNVRLSGVSGPMVVKVEGGDVQIAGAANNVDVEVRNGSIDLGVYRVAAGSTIELRTTNGHLGLTLPASSSTKIEARTSAGTITTEGLTFAERQLNPDGAGARFQGSLGQGGTTIMLRTENGNVSLTEGTMMELPMLDDTMEMEEMPDTTRMIPPDTLREIVPTDTSRMTPDTTEPVDTLRPPVGVRSAPDTLDA